MPLHGETSGCGDDLQGGELPVAEMTSRGHSSSLMFAPTDFKKSFPETPDLTCSQIRCPWFTRRMTVTSHVAGR